MAITAETRTDIIELVVTTLNAVPGTTLLNELVAIVDGGGTLNDVAANLTARADFQGIYPLFQTAEEFANAWLGTLVPEASAEALAEGVAVAVGLLNGGATRADLMIEAQTFLSGASESDASFGTSAANFNNKVEVATYHTVTKKQDASDLTALQNVLSGVTSNDTSVTTANTAIDTGNVDVGAKSFIHTTGIDTFTGGAAGDTFTGQIDDNTASANTFNAADTIDGGAGTDVLNVIADTSGAGLNLPAATISNIENIFIRNVSGQALTADANIPSGEKQLWADRSTSAVTFSNVGSGVTVGIKGDGSSANAAVTANHSVTVTSGSLAIDGDTTGGAVTIGGASMSTLTIASTGGTNKLASLALPAANKTITIDATTGLDLGTGITGSTATDGTITVNGAGAVDLGSGAILNAYDTVDASGNSGGVTVTLDAETDTKFTGGSGKDKVTTGAALSTGSVDAGDGEDTLTVAATAHITSTIGKKYTNFELLTLADGQTIDMDHVAGITGVTVNDASAGATIVNDLSAAQAANLTFSDINDAATISVKGATTVGTNDSLNITISNGGLPGSTLVPTATDGTDWTIAGVETITLNVVDDYDADNMSNITGMTKLIASGGGDIDIITGALNLGANGSVDFSGVSGAVIFNAAALATNAFLYTGGSKGDTVTTSAIGGSIFNTGAGNDSITTTQPTGGSTGTTINGGAGKDTVVVNTLGNDAIDRIVLKFAAGDSVSDSSTTGISTTLTDDIQSVDTAAAAGTTGNHITFDTEVSATAVTAGTTDVKLGTTTVTNAGDFFVNIDAAATVYIYQDTDGDKIIEAGEFAVQLSGVTTAIAAAGEFTVSGGNLLFIGL